MKYKYKGTAKVHLPHHEMTVQPGETVEVAEEINHPDFELITEKEKKGKNK